MRIAFLIHNFTSMKVSDNSYYFSEFGCISEHIARDLILDGCPYLASHWSPPIVDLYADPMDHYFGEINIQGFGKKTNL